MLTPLISRVEKLENTIVLMSQNAPTNITVTMQDNYAHLEDNYKELKQNQLRLEKMLDSCENRSNELKEEITSLKQVSTINQLQTISDLQTQLLDVKHNLILGLSENQARGQDLVSIYNDIGFVKQDYALFVSNNSRDITDLKNVQIILSSQINKTMQELSEEVTLTAFGTSNGVKSPGTTLLFPDIRESFGISNLSAFKSTGHFTCEQDGLYLVSVNVVSCSTVDSYFYVYKNNVPFPLYYIGYTTTSARNCNSGTGIIQIHLALHDIVYVKSGPANMEVYDMYSSFTVTKLK